MEVNTYLKGYLHYLIPPFTDWVTQSVKLVMHYYLDTRNNSKRVKPLLITYNII